MPEDSDTQPKIIGRGRFLQLVNDDGWEYVERVNASGIVVLIPVTDDDEIVLIEQNRPAVGCSVIELPAGLAGDIPGHETEALAQAAQRELEEETGYTATELTPVVTGPPSAGQSSEMVTLFLATGLKRVGEGGGDDSEDIEVHVIPLRDVHRWLNVRSMGFASLDPKIYAGIYFARRFQQSRARKRAQKKARKKNGSQ